MAFKRSSGLSREERVTFVRSQKQYPNFVTPELIAVRKNKEGEYIELSHGRIFDKEMYGVTVLKRDKDEKSGFGTVSEKSKPFGTRKEAEAYYEGL